MIMFLSKACPKCRGDITDESDRFGAYIKCYQCGWMRDAMTVQLRGIPDPSLIMHPNHPHRKLGYATR